MVGDGIENREPDDERPETDEASELEAPLEPFRGPPLRIIHFFAWTAVAAVLVTLNEQEFAPRPEQYAAGAFVRGMSILLNIRLAASLVGVWVLSRWRVPGMLRRLQAGHWLVIGAAAFVLVAHLADLGCAVAANATWAYPPAAVQSGSISFGTFFAGS